MKDTKTRNIVITGLMIALMLVLQITGIGLIKIGIINITFYCTIIAIGTMVLGLHNGIILGAAFGAISFWSAIQAPSGLVAPIMAESVFYVALMCFVPRILVPFVTYGIRKLLNNCGENDKIGIAAGAAIGSLTNTVLYLGLLVLGYAITVAENPTLLATVGSIALAAGLPEAAAAALVATPVVLALKKIYK